MHTLLRKIRKKHHIKEVSQGLVLVTPQKTFSGVKLYFKKSIKKNQHFIPKVLSNILISNLSPYPEEVIESLRKRETLEKF